MTIKKLTLVPVAGGYQKEKTCEIIDESREFITVKPENHLGLWKFSKKTGLRADLPKKEKSIYKIKA